MNLVNRYGLHPNQKYSFIPGRYYKGDVDLPGLWGEDHVESTALFNHSGQQIGVRNETLENHLLHPGIVERRIVKHKGNYHILTEGGGYGEVGLLMFGWMSGYGTSWDRGYCEKPLFTRERGTHTLWLSC